MNKLLIVCFLALLTVSFHSCYYDVEEELYPAAGSTCDTTNVTYNATIKPIIDANCNNCHSQALAQGGVILETYAQVKDYALTGTLAGVIKQEAGFSPMPQGGAKLNDCSIAKLDKWISSQYPEN